MALLEDDFLPAIFQDDPTSCRTIADAHTLASRSARMASCFLELEKVNEDLESKLRDDFNSILNSMTDLSLSPAPKYPSPPEPPTRLISTHNSSFTIAAYSWLLENVANPYPSLTIKEALAERYNYLLSAVNTWFVNARRRVGWTALCRDYFNNCRADTLDAAYRALVDEDPNRPLPPNIIHAFISVKATVEGLCSSIFTKGALTDDLGVIARDTIDRETTLVRKRKRRELKETVGSPETSEAESQNEKQVAQPSCTYPDSLCSLSPVPPLVESFTDDSDEEEEVSPPVLAGRKRRLSCSGAGDSTPSTLNTKRRKHMSSTPYPSCISSDQITQPTFVRQSSTDSPASHKRRLSNVDTSERIRYPQELTAELNHPVVSDPPLSTLGSEQGIDEWFNSNFDDLFSLPPSADVIKPDSSVEWEVELFNNYIMPFEEPQTQPSKSLNLCTENQALEGPLAFDNIIQFLENGSFVTPSELMDQATTLSAADCSGPRYLSESAASIGWTSPLHWEAFDLPLDSIFDQCHAYSLALPDTHLSTPQLPRIHTSTFNPLSSEMAALLRAPVGLSAGCTC